MLGSLGCLLAGILVAAGLHRLWMLEGLILPVRISGGSMAPALIGEHVSITCSDCRYPFVYDAQRPAELGAVCPNCGYRHTDQSAVVKRGQHVLIDRFGLWTGLPQRWDFVAFTDPDKPALSSVKRVIGMPHEQIEIRGGELYVDGQLLQKNLAEFRHMAILVHDDTFRPSRARSLPLRWRPAQQTSRWKPTPHGYSCGPGKRSADLQSAPPVLNPTEPVQNADSRSVLPDSSLQLVPSASTSARKLCDQTSSQTVSPTLEPQTTGATDRSDQRKSHSALGRSASDASNQLSKWHPDELSSTQAADPLLHTSRLLGALVEEFLEEQSAAAWKPDVGQETVRELASGKVRQLRAGQEGSPPFNLPPVSVPFSYRHSDRQMSTPPTAGHPFNLRLPSGSRELSDRTNHAFNKSFAINGATHDLTSWDHDLLTNLTTNAFHHLEEAIQPCKKSSAADGTTDRWGAHRKDHHANPNHFVIDDALSDMLAQPLDWLVYENWRCYANPLARTDGVPVSDHYGYNQGVSRQTKEVTDLVLSGYFELHGSGCLVLAIYDGREWMTCLLSTVPLDPNPTEPVRGELGTSEKKGYRRLDSALERLQAATSESLVPGLHQPERFAAGLAKRDELGALGTRVDREPAEQALGVMRAQTIEEQDRRGSSESSSRSFSSQEPPSEKAGELHLYQGVRLLVKTSFRLPATFGLEFGLLDQQVLVAIDGSELGRWSYVPDQRPRKALALPLALACSAGLTLNARDLRIHRDLYYLDPLNTGQPWKMPRALGAHQWFLLGDNVPISRDGRHWRSPGLDQRFLRGRVCRQLLPKAPSYIVTNADR
jgi:hypothetical protein